VTPEGPFLIYASHDIDDSTGGNDDGLVSPGETIWLTISLENVGPDPATGVLGELSTTDEYVDVTDPGGVYGTIESGAQVPNVDPYLFTVDEGCPNGHGINFSLSATDDGRTAWGLAVPEIVVAAPELAVAAAVVVDDGVGGNGNGILEAGETAWIELTLENVGAVGVDYTTGVLTTEDQYAAVTAAYGEFGEILSGGSAAAETHSFRVSVSPSAPPAHEVSFVLAVSGNTGAYTHSQDIAFSVELGGTVTEGPCGPDAYGYYGYDATDVWTGQAPVYDWVEISGVGSLITGITNEDAQIVTLDLPFTFEYYGLDYTQVSVCSNGFLAMGFDDYRLGDNSGIPNTHGPTSMIAPFWDDLDPSNAGDIYQWYDSANDRWIVQFDAVVHYGGNYPETFQVILYDPSAYPTATGDGVIIFQYQTASYLYQNTVGIENAAETVGIQYVYDLSYDPCAAPIANGSAIKFTTEPPGIPPLWLVVEDSDVDDTVGGNGNGFIEPTETAEITLTLGNLGDNTATGVTATITTSDPDATIVNGSTSFGDIGPGGSAVGTPPFSVTIAAVPTGDTIEFDLHLSAGGVRYDEWEITHLVCAQTERTEPLQGRNHHRVRTAVACSCPGRGLQRDRASGGHGRGREPRRGAAHRGVGRTGREREEGGSRYLLLPPDRRGE